MRLFDEYVSRVYDARADIDSALAEINALNGQIADAQAALPGLSDLYNAYQLANEHGNVDVLSYYAAWNSVSQKKLDVLKLQQQLADARIALELATGRYFPSSVAGMDSAAPTAFSAAATLPGDFSTEQR
jgi:outer membrane protein TolC